MMSLKKRIAITLLGLVLALAAFGLIAEGQQGQLQLVSPQPGAVVSGQVAVMARAEGFKDMQYLIFGVDEDRPLATNARPFTWQLDTTTLTDGPHTLVVEAHSRWGWMASSQPVQIIVANQAAQPASSKPDTPAVSVPVEGPAPALPTVTVLAPAQPTVVQLDEPAPLSLAASPAGGLLVSRPVEGGVLAATPGAAPVMVATVPPPVGQPAEQPTEVTVYLDGRPLGANSVVMNGHQALVPFRQLVELAGGKVAWLRDTRQALGRRSGLQMLLTPGAASALVNGKVVPMPLAAQLTDGRTIAPLRFCSTQLGLQVAWDESRWRVDLSSEPATALASAR